MTPMEYQRDPAIIRPQMDPMHLQNNPSERSRQEGSMQHQNQLEIMNKNLQYDRDSVQIGRQREPMQFHGQPSQIRGQMYPMSINHQKLGNIQRRRTKDPFHFQNQISSQTGRQINSMQLNFSNTLLYQRNQEGYKHQNIRRPWNSYPKNIGRSNNDEGTLLTTEEYDDWVPPHRIITDSTTPTYVILFKFYSLYYLYKLIGHLHICSSSLGMTTKYTYAYVIFFYISLSTEQGYLFLTLTARIKVQYISTYDPANCASKF